MEENTVYIVLVFERHYLSLVRLFSDKIKAENFAKNFIDYEIQEQGIIK